MEKRVKLKKGIKQLVEAAEKKTRGIRPDEAHLQLGSQDTVFVDVRDVRELQRDGMIPGAFHAPRGMLEFWVDPESPYYKPVFTEGSTFILYCAADWRATLAAATLAEMGVRNVYHLEGGLREWKKEGRPWGTPPRKTAPAGQSAP
jgi:rhodanese-related sulfurtransferase